MTIATPTRSIAEKISTLWRVHALDPIAIREQMCGRLIMEAIDTQQITDERMLGRLALTREDASPGLAQRVFATVVGVLECAMPNLSDADHRFTLQCLEIAEFIDSMVHKQNSDSKGKSPATRSKDSSLLVSTTTHSADFTSVVWFGKNYTFSVGQQAEAVKLLWEEWERGGRGAKMTISQATIGDRIGSTADSFRMDTLFRNHRAYGNMIKCAEKGTFYLAVPSQKTNHRRITN